MLSPLPPRVSAVDACADALRQRILTGELAPDTRLPPERELATQLGASRVTVRSALARLAESHLLSVRQGSGYVVRDFRRDGGPDLLPGLVSLARGRDIATIAGDLLLVRRQLATAVLERLSAGASPAALARVARSVDALEAQLDAGATAFAEADVAVVGALLEATHSAVLQLCLNPVLAVLREMPALRDAMYAAPATNVAAWRALIAWAKAPDAAVIPAVIAEMARRDRETLARLSTRKPR